MKKRTKIFLFAGGSITCIVALTSLVAVLTAVIVRIFQPAEADTSFYSTSRILVNLGICIVATVISYYCFDRIPFRKK